MLYITYKNNTKMIYKINDNLFKIDKYYYLTDNSIIEENDYALTHDGDDKKLVFVDKNIINMCGTHFIQHYCNKIICTTNPNLPILQIAFDDELPSSTAIKLLRQYQRSTSDNIKQAKEIESFEFDVNTITRKKDENQN